MTFINSILSGIISGFISSLLVYGFWQLQKPRLMISNEIAKNDKGEYRIKIINKSKKYIRNVIFRLQLVTNTNAANGYVFNTYNLELPYPEILMIGPYEKKSEKAEYAIRIVLPKDMEKYWIEDIYTHLKLIVHCSNELNTASRTYEQKFYKKSCIKNGEFAWGDSMEITEECIN